MVDSEISTDELESVWKIDDLMNKNEQCVQEGDRVTIHSEEKNYRIVIRLFNRYGGGLPAFYKGYLYIDAIPPHTTLECFDNSILVEQLGKTSWCWYARESIDFSRHLDDQYGDWYGPRQIVLQAHLFLAQLT
jgi:hypothetical protein